MMYKSEALMSKDFELYLRKYLGKTYFKEYQGLFGIPDYVYFSKERGEILVIAFELKLYNWKCAIIQAFRYRSFSDYSYVVLPEYTVHNALEHLDLFRQYNIGLMSFSKNDLKILYKPCFKEPYSSELRQKLVKKIRLSRSRGLHPNSLGMVNVSNNRI